jgi:fatty-acyl-CoA synthase
MGDFANLADLKAIEAESAWADRDVARTMYDFVSRAKSAHGARPAISEDPDMV